MNLPNLLLLATLLMFLQQQHGAMVTSTPLYTQEALALLKFRDRVVSDPSNALSTWTLLSHPCSWFGVHCSFFLGHVVELNLKDLCLSGTLAPELGQLSYLKSIILRNNSFHGLIPTQLADLPLLQVLDLGYNHFTPPLPPNFANFFSLSLFLLDNNNDLLHSFSPDLTQLQLLSEHQFCAVSVGLRCNTEPVSWYASQQQDLVRRSLLRVQPPSESSQAVTKRVTKRRSAVPRGHLNLAVHPLQSHSHSSTSPSSPPSHSHSHLPQSPDAMPTHSHSHVSPSRFPAPTHSPSHVSQSPSPSGTFAASVPAPLPAYPVAVSASPASAQATRVPESSSVSSKSPDNSTSKHHKVIIWATVTGSFALLIILAVGALICRSSKVVSVKPWATGLSGQLQRAFVSGVPKLKRPELEIACEDFSNIVGSLVDGTVYKGILSSGVEIAVVASSVKCSEEWTKSLELQFQKKIETLSKVNHKNFVNLIGYCEEEKPFTRMMVFEYAPNGTLFEHLHIKEAERLDWRMRLRILMGMAYCLERMHQLEPPIPHRDMQSCSIYLSEDYAAKISDFSFWSNGSRSKMRSPSMQLLEASSTDIESNVFNFGLVLFEMITGRVPYMDDDCSVADWVLELLEKDHISRLIMDPTLSSFQEEQVRRLFYIIRDCINPNAGDRPSMRVVAAQLREITGMGPQEATPKLSPLWWAELEILSSEVN